jgi:hypothetical protein
LVDLNLGGVLLLLVPGLCVYAALYGLIGLRSLTFSPAPPPANSIKAIMIVVLASIGVHAGTALLILILKWTGCFDPGVNIDIYSLGVEAAVAKAYPAKTVLHLAGGGMLQGLLGAIIVRGWLRWCVWRNCLPEWLFGWTADFANWADDDDKVLVAVVLTNIDLAGGAVAYGGTLRELGLGTQGEIKRIMLDDCQRYIIDLTKPSPAIGYPPLSVFDHFAIDSAQIRSVTFEVLEYRAPT